LTECAIRVGVHRFPDGSVQMTYQQSKAYFTHILMFCPVYGRVASRRGEVAVG
jgi:hypothetical protein